MFKLENDAQRQRTIKRIEEVKARIEKVRTTHGPEAAELYSKAIRGHVADLKEKSRSGYMTRRRKGMDNVGTVKVSSSTESSHLCVGDCELPFWVCVPEKLNPQPITLPVNRIPFIAIEPVQDPWVEAFPKAGDAVLSVWFPGQNTRAPNREWRETDHEWMNGKTLDLSPLTTGGFSWMSLGYPVSVTLFTLLAFFFAAGADMKTIEKIEIYNARTGRVEKIDPVVRSDAEWKKILTPEQHEVTRRKGTERPFSKQCAVPPSGKGIYQCVGCGTDLFAYGEKFESGTGWPSFWNPVSPLNVKAEEDRSLGMRRVEVLCARCGAHLGHLFDDGPPPTGKRYCINSVALKLSAESPR